MPHPKAQQLSQQGKGFAAEPLDRSALSSLSGGHPHVVLSSHNPQAVAGLRVRLMAALYKPVGAGELRLASADPHDQPDLDFRYLEDPWDRERLRECVRLCIRLLEHDAYRDIVAERVSPTDEDLASNDTLDRWIDRTLPNATTAHMSGTCKMGPSSDPTAVVDQYCRVHGVEGLGIVDTSIMPDIVCTGTHATAMMLGERAADLIMERL